MMRGVVARVTQRARDLLSRSGPNRPEPGVTRLPTLQAAPAAAAPSSAQVVAAWSLHEITRADGGWLLSVTVPSDQEKTVATLVLVGRDSQQEVLLPIAAGRRAGSVEVGTLMLRLFDETVDLWLEISDDGDQHPFTGRRRCRG